jgi:DNA-directed RNA polymerase subunit RPC12/RpoP
VILALHRCSAVYLELGPLGRTTDTSTNRRRLLASEIAVCIYCFQEFAPRSIVEWCDEEDMTAICPHCGVDAIVGFDGPVDRTWLEAAHRRAFG